MKQYVKQKVTINITRQPKEKLDNDSDNNDSTHESIGIICDFDIEAALEQIPL